MLACWMTWLPTRHPVQLVGAGLLLGVLTLFRQLSGVWDGPARRRAARTSTMAERRLVARALSLIMLAALGVWLIVSPGRIAYCWSRCGWRSVDARPARVPAPRLARACHRCSPLLPLVIYHRARSLRSVRRHGAGGFGERRCRFGSRGWPLPWRVCIKPCPHPTR